MNPKQSEVEPYHSQNTSSHKIDRNKMIIPEMKGVSTLKKWTWFAHRDDHKTATIQNNHFVLIIETIGKPQKLCMPGKKLSNLSWLESQKTC